MKIYRPILMAACALVMSTGAVSCLKYEKKANSSTTGTTTMVCDASFQNILQQEIDVFEYQYPDAHILARYEPQSVAIDSLMSLNTKTIVIARDLTDQEKRVLRNKKKVVKSAKIAVDAVALIVNKDNPIEMLTVGEVADILSGSSRMWNDLEPSELGEIAVIFDDKGSSLVSYMRDSLLNGGELGPNVYAQGSVPKVFDAVKKNRNAIGVLGVSWITSDMAGADISPDSLAVQMLSDEPVMGATLSDDIKVLKIRRNDEVTAYKP
ncbi:MAG: substrate-binding domain-containing protein, partial [Muribaculaceae bacterium]|nr:substrate-binding domain-containing protein [Muribaculaceae bacterium]